MQGRVLVCKIGLDGHESGAKFVNTVLRDAGYEVIYTGMRRTVEDVVQVAIQEDVDLIGLSILSGAHMGICEELLTRLRAVGIGDLPVVVGGIVPDADREALTALGVRCVFTPGATSRSILDPVSELVAQSRRRKQLFEETF